MKKTIANILFLTACIAGIIFLLLPFLETTPPATTDLKSARPQVSSSNPLTAIAKRLASIFGRKPAEKNARLLTSARNGYEYTPPPAANAASAPAAARAAHISLVGNTAPLTETPAAPAEVPVPPVPSTQYGDASLQTDDGEWVLVRQTTPQSGAPGMHEINVHENPYDRYIKQERARRFQPTAQKTQIPDSKWARLIRPVTSFFGLDGARPVGNPTPAVYREEGSVRRGTSDNSLASAKNVGGLARRTRLPWPDITPLQWATMSEAERQQERDRRSVAEFAELLSGTRAAEEAATIVADATYPNPKDQDKRDNYRTQLTEENKQKIKEGLLEKMRTKAAGQEQVDELSHIMSGCSNASLPKSACNPDQTEPKGSLFSANEITAAQEKSRQTFFETTQYIMPNDVPLLPVLGPTTPETIAQMGGLDDVEKTAEIYKFLYQNKNCQSQDCYWIANSLQSNHNLSDALTLANAKLVTDPDNTYPGYREAFVQYKLAQARQQAQPGNEGDGPAAPTEQEIRPQAEKQFTENAANWIPVTADELKDMHQRHTLEAANPQTPQTDAELAIPYLTNPAYAEQMYHLLGESPIFGYANEPLTVVENAATGQDPVQADKQIITRTAELITKSLAENVQDALEVMQGVTQQAVSEGVQAGLNQQINQFNQSGQSWQDMLNAVKNKNTPPNGNGKK